MPANDVLIGAPVTGTGGVLFGPTGTPLPTDESVAPDPALVPQGYVSEDGMTMTTDRSTEKVKAWGGETVRIVQTDFSVTFQFEFLETTEETLKRLHGAANVTTTGTKSAVVFNAERLESGVWIFDMKDGKAKIRIVVPNGEVSEVGDVKFTHSEVTKRQVTIEALPDAQGNQVYMYLDKGTPAA